MAFLESFPVAYCCQVSDFYAVNKNKWHTIENFLSFHVLFLLPTAVDAPHAYRKSTTQHMAPQMPI